MITFIFLFLILFGSLTPDSALGARHSTLGQKQHIEWSRQNRWPAYYAYYGTTIYGSSYLYSYPLNSNFYHSYPSYYTNYVYPSYPFNGKYYVNQTPIPNPYFYRSRSYSKIRPSVTPSYSYQIFESNGRTGVFLSE